MAKFGADAGYLELPAGPSELLWDEFAISLAEEVQKAAVAYGYAKPEEREETRTSRRAAAG